MIHCFSPELISSPFSSLRQEYSVARDTWRLSVVQSGNPSPEESQSVSHLSAAFVCLRCPDIPEGSSLSPGSRPRRRHLSAYPRRKRISADKSRNASGCTYCSPHAIL